jgi:hypothetical protein
VGLRDTVPSCRTVTESLHLRPWLVRFVGDWHHMSFVIDSADRVSTTDVVQAAYRQPQ